MLFIIFLGMFSQLISTVKLEKDLPKSSCPHILKYTSLDKTNGMLEMALDVASADNLTGVWIRIVFDKKVDILVHDTRFQVKQRNSNNRDILLKSTNLILLIGEVVHLKISVKYSGPEVPNVIEYRLNAITICPDPHSTKPYPNDLKIGKQFVQSMISQTPKNNKFKCGELEEHIGDVHQWQASIFFKENNQENYTCEGILISPKHVITAAHCVTYLNSERTITPSESLIVYFGKSHIDDDNTEYYKVKRIIPYPGYQAENLLNDIALIELGDTPKYLEPICLPDKLNLNKEVETLVGYTKTKYKFTRLGFTKIRRIDDAECFQNHQRFHVLLGDNNYCAEFYAGNPPCVGDSGSASMVMNRNKWELRGIISAGSMLQHLLSNTWNCEEIETCENLTNIILVDISKYLKWITNIIYD